MGNIGKKVTAKNILLDTWLNFHLKKIKKLEDDLFQPDRTMHAYKDSDLSYPRFNKIFTAPILFGNWKLFSTDNKGSVLFLNSFFKGMKKAFEFSNINLNAPTKADYGFFKQLEDYKKHLGINYLGYSPVPRDLIFKNMTIPHKNAFILLLKVDHNEQDEESTYNDNYKFFQAYMELWEKTLQLAAFLRDNG